MKRLLNLLGNLHNNVIIVTEFCAYFLRVPFKIKFWFEIDFQFSEKNSLNARKLCKDDELMTQSSLRLVRS